MNFLLEEKICFQHYSRNLKVNFNTANLEHLDQLLFFDLNSIKIGLRWSPASPGEWNSISPDWMVRRFRVFFSPFYCSFDIQNIQILTWRNKFHSRSRKMAPCMSTSKCCHRRNRNKASTIFHLHISQKGPRALLSPCRYHRDVELRKVSIANEMER